MPLLIPESRAVRRHRNRSARRADRRAIAQRRVEEKRREESNGWRAIIRRRQRGASSKIDYSVLSLSRARALSRFVHWRTLRVAESHSHTVVVKFFVARPLRVGTGRVRRGSERSAVSRSSCRHSTRRDSTRLLDAPASLSCWFPSDDRRLPRLSHCSHRTHECFWEHLALLICPVPSCSVPLRCDAMRCDAMRLPVVSPGGPVICGGRRPSARPAGRRSEAKRCRREPTRYNRDSIRKRLDGLHVSQRVESSRAAQLISLLRGGLASRTRREATRRDAHSQQKHLPPPLLRLSPFLSSTLLSSSQVGARRRTRRIAATICAEGFEGSACTLLSFRLVSSRSVPFRSVRASRGAGAGAAPPRVPQRAPRRELLVSAPLCGALCASDCDREPQRGRGRPDTVLS